ncbi:MAG: hypothetical protein Q8R24_10160 [Legionellaceae bacterium]|nr:hypothetical protein [Legionellaceae bacterium]
MSDVNDLSLEYIWGLVAACCVASVGFVIAFCADPSDELKPLRGCYPQANIQSDDISQRKEITESISRYATLVTNANVDRNIIMQTLKTYNLEAKTFITDKEQIQKKYEQARQSIMRFSYFQATDEHLDLLREQERTNELMATFQQLMQSYPNSSLGKSATLEEVEFAYKAFEEHHDQVLNFVEVMFSDLFSSLNKSKLSGCESKGDVTSSLII